MQPYSIPSETCRTEIIINKSRFITTLGYAPTVEDARQFISAIKAEMSDANHHVYAFRVGYANSVTEGMSDDGEPTGTSGPPTLAVIRGADIGDIVCVTTRYFGGKKLGTGGLVKAYTESAQTALESLQTELRVTKITLTACIPYSLYNIVENYISSTDISIEDKVFTEDVTLTLELLESQQSDFVKTLVDMTHGQVQFID
jgi:uncharacterized YigZ family protein